MSHIALYRKFRPIVFADIVGQDHIITTLKNQIKNDRVGHAYLFNGGRGTGKTTAAKILARAVNCLEHANGEPCNKCEVCKGILSEKNTDVVEMDAASNNGVDDIRQMIEKVNFLPTASKYRVYIIDEVHMLSSGAFNALLKTLEEPPLHCIFILATTEPQKLPATILSRCQRFDFKKLDNANIVKRLEIICKESNININNEALETIAVLAEGSSRDSISILETCIGEEGELIDAQRVKDIVGVPSLEYINKIVNGIVNYDTINALNSLDEVLKQGKDLSNCVFEIIKYLRDTLIYKVTNTLELYNKQEMENIGSLAKSLSKERLLYLINLFIEVENSIKTSTQQLIIVQAVIIKSSSSVVTQEEILETKKVETEKKVVQEVKRTEENKGRLIEVKKVEESRENLGVNLVEEIKKSEESKENLEVKLPEEAKIAEESLESIEIKETEVENIQKIEEQAGEYVSYWKDVLEKLKKDGKVILYTNLMKTKAREDGDTLLIEFEGTLSDFGRNVIEKADNKKELTSIISKVSGKNLKIKYVDNKQGSVKPKNNNEDLIENLGIAINVIDE